MNKKFLHVGSGRQNKFNTTNEFKNEYWDEVRLDIDPDVKPDVISSITDMSSIDSNQFDAVFSSHNIEHLFPHEVPIALKEMHRVLNDTGYLIITCPDIQPVCKEVAKGNLVNPLYQSTMGPISAIDIMYGLRTDIAKGNHYMAHKCAFTGPVMRSTLLGSGFKSCEVISRESAYVLWAIAFKDDIFDQDKCIDILKMHLEINLA